MTHTPTRRGAAARRTRYQLPRRPLANDARFGVQNDVGKSVFAVHALPPDALVFEDPAGGERCTIHEATYGLQRMMRISTHGQPAAWVHKEVVVPVRERYSIDLGRAVLDVRGCVLEHEYAIRHGRRTIAVVSRAWANSPEAYGVEVANAASGHDGHDDALILATTVCITLMAGDAG